MFGKVRHVGVFELQHRERGVRKTTTSKYNYNYWLANTHYHNAN